MAKINRSVVIPTNYGYQPKTSAVDNIKPAIHSPYFESKYLNTTGLVEIKNAFFKWSRARKSEKLLSISAAHAVVQTPLKNISNEALVSKLSNIDLSISDAKKLNFESQTSAELEVGHIMVGEQIRRLLLAVEGKNNPFGVTRKIAKEEV